jgi:hypothetical protein
MGRENASADQCQTGCEDIHVATIIVVGVTIGADLFPEFFVDWGKLFRGNRWRATADEDVHYSFAVAL